MTAKADRCKATQTVLRRSKELLAASPIELFMQVIEIEIVNWEKFQPRKDIQSMPWFRLDSKIIFEQKLFGLSAGQRWIWICLLCMAAERRFKKFIADVEYISFHSNLAAEKVITAIQVFEKTGLIKTQTQIRTDSIESDRKRALHNITEQNITKHNRTYSCRDKSSTRTKKFNDWDLNLAELMQEAIIAQNPKATTKSKSGLEVWADTFRKMRTVDNLSTEDIEKALDWVFKNDFWANVIQSPSGLRKNWNKVSGQMQKGGSISDSFRRIDERTKGAIPECPF